MLSFLGPKCPDLGQKILFSYARLYPSAWGPFWHLWIYCATFRYRVTPVFVRGPSRCTKKSSPTPLWGHRLPVTTLASRAGWITDFLRITEFKCLINVIPITFGPSYVPWTPFGWRNPKLSPAVPWKNNADFIFEFLLQFIINIFILIFSLQIQFFLLLLCTRV